MKKKYRVDFNYEVGGHAIVEAKSKKAAEVKLFRILECDGIEGIEERKTTYREFYTNNAIEVKND